jgi:hypothetical protein
LQAISLWQPYASLIAAKAKPFETRHWAAQSHRIGQRVAIHAALRRPTQTEVAELFDDVANALGFCHWHKRIPYGAVVCTATLIGCHLVTHWNGPKPAGSAARSRMTASAITAPAATAGSWATCRYSIQPFRPKGGRDGGTGITSDPGAMIRRIGKAAT